MIVKIHRDHHGQMVLAICDSNIIGKKFTEGKLQLDLTGGFYKGKETAEHELLELVKRAYILNMVGKESIEFASRHNLINKQNIITVEGIPHAQCVIVRE